MIKRILVSLLAIAGIAMTSCQAPTEKTTPLDLVAIGKTIDEKNVEFAKAFVSGDSTAMINHYTDDAKLFPPNSLTVAGRKNIAALVKQYLTYGIKEFKDETTGLYGAGDAVVEEGNLFMGDGKGGTIDKGKYIAVWKLVNGDWKVSSNMWNTSLPPAAQ